MSLLNHGRGLDRIQVGNEASMNRRLIAAMVLAGSILASEAAFASPLALHAPVHAMYGNQNMVKFNLRNGTNDVIKLKAGETELSIQPGKTVAVKLAVGEKVVAEEASTKLAAGEVLATATTSLSNATIVIH